MSIKNAKVRRSSGPIREAVQCPEFEHSVARALKEVMHSLRQCVELEMRANGSALTFAHCMPLQVLARQPGLSGAQVARRVQVTAQSMNVLLRSLLDSGYVLREPNPENQRADQWYLTAEGLDRLNEARVLIENVMGRMLDPLGDRNAQQLAEWLRLCANALSDKPGPGDAPRAPRRKTASRTRA